MEAAADKIEIMALSTAYMRGLDRLDGEIQRSTFWDDAFLSYGIYELAPMASSSVARQHLWNRYSTGLKESFCSS